MPRTKKFAMDGLELPYSPLTVDQAQDIISRKAPEIADQKARDEFYRAWNLDVIQCGLNNALKALSADTSNSEWSHARITSELDPVVYNELEDAILEMTGLVRKTLGEAPAAT